jgi:hypothetical protein
MAGAVRLRRELDVESFEKALNVIVARHESCGPTIEDVNEEPVGAVHKAWSLHLTSTLT